ncbi:MAG TPA: AMP-binding protein, partial [Solirubrobacteraceae bacterium]|nr:AMP-binding protein [Solirubrobacteraceae bacterium]
MLSEGQIGVRCGERFATYPELFARAARAATGLHGLGVGAGDRVALLLRNSLEFLEASIATVPLGASAVPINWHWRGEEIAHVLDDSAAKVLVVHADLWPAIAERLPDGVALVIVPGEGEHERPERALYWPDWLSVNEPWAEPPEASPVSIIYTSGTTGRPKGVVRTPATPQQREAVQGLIAEIFQLGEGERTVIPAPMYHT